MRSAISSRRREWYDPVYGYHNEFAGWQVGRISSADRRTAIAIYQAALAPCPADTMQRELARLRAVTVSRSTEAADLKLAMAAYAEALREYPPDVVAAACRDRWKFWPALSELLDRADELVADRRAMLAAIRDAPKP